MRKSANGMTRVTCDWPGCKEEFRSASFKGVIPEQLAEAKWRVESETKVIGPSGQPMGIDRKNKLHICKAHTPVPRMEGARL